MKKQSPWSGLYQERRSKIDMLAGQKHSEETRRKMSISRAGFKTDEERFFANVYKDGPNIIGTECWIWFGTRNIRGYGWFRIMGKHLYAHRASYQLTHKTDLGRQFVCHHCDNPSCVRPEHLFLGDDRANRQDALRKNRVALARLTVAQVIEIKSELKKGIGGAVIAARFGVHPATIRCIAIGKTWSSIGPSVSRGTE